MILVGAREGEGNTGRQDELPAVHLGLEICLALLDHVDFRQPWFLDFDFLGTNMRTLFQIHPINLSVAIWDRIWFS